MCGIAGIYGLGDAGDQLSARVQRMVEAERHRGPDGVGVTQASANASAISLGHRRLSIIDLSEAGKQPMIDVATGVSIVYNGETYNFADIRSQLTHLGHRFCSATDSEVVLRGYLEWGEAMPEKLNGIFAFAIWDPRDGSLLLARDGLGVKPLYVYEDAEHFVFASEVRAILASGLVAPRVDTEGLRSYLAFGAVQEPLTLIQRVRSLTPGTTLKVRERERRVTRFYDFPNTRERTAPPLETIRQLLRQAVQSQLVSDVPVGAFLSGGIDSSAIVALMRDSGESDVQSFNVCFKDGSGEDERRFARLAARAAGATHHDVEIGPQEFFDSLETALAAYDQPSVDGVNTWFVSRAVRSHGVTVALSGVGGDELFVGYDRFARQLLADRIARAGSVLPQPVRMAIGRSLDRLATTDTLHNASSLLSSRLPGYFAARRLFSPARIESLLSSSHRGEGEDGWLAKTLYPLAQSAATHEPINQISRLELQTYMRSTLLRDTDQMSMAHALEVRVPLIDRTLIDAILPIVPKDKISPRIPKRLLVEPLIDLLPHDCVYRTKRGFTLPFDAWLKTPSGARAMQDRLRSEQSMAFIDANAALATYDSFVDGRGRWSRPWSLLVLADWLTRNRVTL